MFDTIDFIIKDFDKTDLQISILDEIKQGYFNYIEETNKYIRGAVRFEHNGIVFTYYCKFHYLLIHTNAHKILNKKDITLKDKDLYIKRLTAILNEVIKNLQNHKIELLRIDYHTDINLDDKINDYIYLLNNGLKVYKYMKKRNTYETSIHLSTKKGRQNINIYNKYEESQLEMFKGILRVEIQCKKRLVKGELKKYGIARELDNYWNKHAMENYFFSIVDGFCFNSNYYKRKIANKIIDNSSETDNMKKKLKEFLLDVEKKGLEKVKNSNKYNHCNINTRINKLIALNINPIPIPHKFIYDKLDSLPELTKNITNEKYFK